MKLHECILDDLVRKSNLVAAPASAALIVEPRRLTFRPGGRWI